MMFHLFDKNKEYVSCEFLESGINFGAWGLYHCCQFSHSDKNDLPISAVTSENQYDMEAFFKEKNKVRKQHRNGKISDRCKGCYELKSGVWAKNPQIKQIIIGSSTKCPMGCIYCYTNLRKKLYNTKKDIPVYEILKDLIAKNMISSDCSIAFNNGEPVLMDEFDAIVNLFLDNNIGKLTVNSAGVIIKESVKKALIAGRCEYVVSPDSGNAELYKKIKRVDSFDVVFENIKELLKIKQGESKIRLKYIIIPQINDKIELIKEFIDKAYDIGVCDLIFDFEFNWYGDNLKDKEEIRRLFILHDEAVSYCKKRRMAPIRSIILEAAIAANRNMYDELVMK